MTGEASRPAPAEDAELGGQRRGGDQSLQPRIVDTTRHNTEPSSGQMSVRVLKEVRALALALDHNRAGQHQRRRHPRSASEPRPWSCCSPTNTGGEPSTWNSSTPGRDLSQARRGGDGIKRDGLRCELKMRRVQTGKGNGGCKEDLKGAPKGEKGEKGEKGRGRERGTSLRQRGGFLVNGRSSPRKAGSAQVRGDR